MFEYYVENVGVSFIFFLFYYVKGKFVCFRCVFVLVGLYEFYYLILVVFYDDFNFFYVEIYFYG